MAMLAASAAIASACSPTDPKPVIRTEVITLTVPDSARQPCAEPRPLPDRDLTAREVTTNWSADRAGLRNCETRRAAAVAAVDSSGDAE